MGGSRFAGHPGKDFIVARARPLEGRTAALPQRGMAAVAPENRASLNGRHAISMLSRMRAIATLLLLAASSACATPHPQRAENPSAPGFGSTHSDPRAVALADQVMEALGGRAAWDATRCIEWTFAGKRKLLWDKWTGDFRLDDGNKVVLMNVGTGQGRVFEGGVELTRDPDKTRELLDGAYRIWVNDSYWMFAPYKLKDSGVTLTLAGVRALPDGRLADVLRLEFEGVGVTPDNAYEMWVERDTRRVEQWTYFKRRDDPEPAMTTPWAGWKRYGGIWLASDHGKGPATTDIAVFDEPPTRLSQP